jgi:hypothetical protein
LCGNHCTCQSFGDFDADGDVTLADFADFTNCFSGTTGGWILDGCPCGDFEEDDDSDLTDYAEFYLLLTGS